MAEHLAAHQGNHVADDVVDVQPCSLGFVLRHELADTVDHVGRPVAVLHDPVEGLPDAVEVWGGRRQPVERCVGIGHDGGERLVDLVGDRRGQLAQGRHPGHVRELRLGLLERFRSPRVVSEVASDRERGFDPLGVRPQRRIRRCQILPPGRSGKPADEAHLFAREASVQVWLIRLLERLRTRKLVDAHADDPLGRHSPTPLEGCVDALISVISPDDVDRIR